MLCTQADVETRILLPRQTGLSLRHGNMWISGVILRGAARPQADKYQKGYNAPPGWGWP